MRRLIYAIATTLDGFIAREDGGFDEFPLDEEFLAELLASYPETLPAPFHSTERTRADNQVYDAVLMGRETYEVGLRAGLSSPYPTLDQYVASRTMTESPDPAVTLLDDPVTEAVRDLKQRPGKAIWLCGGSVLATDLLEAGLIDEVILKVNPILFGTGRPLFTRRLDGVNLRPTTRRSFPSGHQILGFSLS